jgi:hypothetical protein
VIDSIEADFTLGPILLLNRTAPHARAIWACEQVHLANHSPRIMRRTEIIPQAAELEAPLLIYLTRKISNFFNSI